MASALLFGAPELDQLAVDGGRPFARGNGDVSPIGAGDDVDRGECRRNRLDAGQQPLVVLGLFFLERRDLLVDPAAIRFDRVDVAASSSARRSRPRRP